MAFIHNAWYCVGWSTTLTEKPQSIQVLGKELVLYRRADVSAVALSNVCPHRFAPLHLGRVVNDQIECPYHGLRFDSTGACALNPHGSGQIAHNNCIPSYPLVERCGTLWVWMGDASRANPQDIVDYPYVSDPQWTGFTNYLHLDVDYQLVLDNLLDLTHSTYIHAGTVGAPRKETANGKDERDYQFYVEGNVVHSDALRRNTPPAPIFAMFQDRTQCDIYAPAALTLPSTLVLDMHTTTAGASKSEGTRLPSAHFITPATETTCHYFYAFFRNERIDDVTVTERMHALVRKAFVDEDAPMIRQCRDRMSQTDLFALKPVILETDAAAVYTRRALAKMVREEQQNQIIAITAVQ